jgi:hypothetical protein
MAASSFCLQFLRSEYTISPQKIAKIRAASNEKKLTWGKEIAMMIGEAKV